jgi:branched-chain amino acid transport system ATP-binding protein
MLDLADVSVTYGAVEALHGVSMNVAAGEVVALLGANGAGKSSLLRAVSRLVPLAGGAISFEGRDLARLQAHQLAGLGIAHCPEGRRIFPDLTVLENLDLGGYAVDSREALERGRERAFRLFPVLAERRAQKGGTLSGGEQQMLAVARAMMISPKLLMLDEPSLGLAPMLMEQIFDTVRRINREEGATVLLVEQNANEALLHSDRAYILEQGRIVLAGPSEELRRDERVRKAYLGV